MAKKTKPEQKTRRLEYQHFDLRKFKVTKDGVDVTHHEGGIDAGEIIKKGEVQPHPDLKKMMDLLQIYMATRLGLLEGWDFCREHIDREMEEMAIKGHKDAIERCNVNGLTFVGEGELAGVMITGSIKVPHSGSTGLSVPKITFKSDTLGYEKEVQTLCEEIKKEVFAYRYQSKKHQLDLVGAIDGDK
ncbi:MAG: hypothetical protein KAR20_06225, partial [Candidatus Heimdallarchaeota archaeon]|nr:hypothetical protein [Candidatus Heimdallarchaeota archaeon]